MTGATIIAMQGDRFWLVKVRSDGYDVMDLLPPLIHADVNPKDLLVGYLRARVAAYDLDKTGDPDGFAPWDHQLSENKREAVFEFTISAKLPKRPEAIFTVARETGDQMIEALGDDSPFYGYTCGYEDYCILVDCATGLSYGLRWNDGNRIDKWLAPPSVTTATE